jgi:hypothetical protein
MGCPAACAHDDGNISQETGMGNIENQSGGLDEESKNGRAARKYADQHPTGKKPTSPGDSKRKPAAGENQRTNQKELNDPKNSV